MLLAADRSEGSGLSFHCLGTASPRPDGGERAAPFTPTMSYNQQEAWRPGLGVGWLFLYPISHPLLASRQARQLWVLPTWSKTGLGRGRPMPSQWGRGRGRGGWGGQGDDEAGRCFEPKKEGGNWFLTHGRKGGQGLCRIILSFMTCELKQLKHAPCFTRPALLSLLLAPALAHHKGGRFTATFYLPSDWRDWVPKVLQGSEPSTPLWLPHPYQ